MCHHPHLWPVLYSADHQNAPGCRLEVDGAETAILILRAVRLVQMSHQDHIKVGEVFCISSNTSSYPGYNGVKEVPTKLMLVFICRSTGGIPRPSDENSESAYFPKSRVPELIKTPSYLERYHAFLEYTGRPIYLEYVTKPEFKLKLKTLI